MFMKKVLHRNNERGSEDYGWLKTNYSFSFANWYDENRMGFGALRVLNDDVIAPSSGFGKHGHKNMEIITIVTHGEVKHLDSMDNNYIVKAGDVQVMSAGLGVLHAESNESTTEPLRLFQLWIQSKEYNIAPRYAQKSFDFQSVSNNLVPLVHSEKALAINQDAYILYGALDASVSHTYTLENKDHGVYIFVIDGTLLIDGEELTSRDALGISEASEVVIQAKSKSAFLVIEVPRE